ncbi:secreted signal peptide protein [Xanthomonas maliensis]|uniref:secreted signal peptide protein n=1 Tax=Xanthomonas maliensis TaxID=1321368 RepID=UPI0012642F82|nr:secreted signal peptide protein [Xanthomonas maliensis]KAB7766374.1 secreted signal peptide protein [Xanthomonas maliensis]
MATRRLTLLGLLLSGMVAFSAQAAGNLPDACTAALKRAFAAAVDAKTLPNACKRIGPVTLGMSKQEVMAALGQPDITHTDAKDPDTLSIAYLYPREFKAQLVQHPRPVDTLVYSQLTVRFRNDRVINLVAFANMKIPLPFNLLGQPVGTHIDRILQAIGGEPLWNASRDYVQFKDLPLAMDVDPDTSAIIGLGIADTKDDLESFSPLGLQLLKDPQSGLINGVR